MAGDGDEGAALPPRAEAATRSNRRTARPRREGPTAASFDVVPGALMDGWLSKRAQGRSKMGRCNWKNRRFLLRPTELQYWSGTECKGQILIRDIHAVEKVSEDAFLKQHMFQVIHSAVLYVQCHSEEERNQWVTAIRSQCHSNPLLHPHYHPGAFLKGSWTCCSTPSRDMKGCEVATPVPPASASHEPLLDNPAPIHVADSGSDTSGTEPEEAEEEEYLSSAASPAVAAATVAEAAQATPRESACDAHVASPLRPITNLDSTVSVPRKGGGSFKPLALTRKRSEVDLGPSAAKRRAIEDAGETVVVAAAAAREPGQDCEVGVVTGPQLESVATAQEQTEAEVRLVVVKTAVV